MLFCLLTSSCSTKHRVKYEFPEFKVMSNMKFELLTDTLFGFSAISDIAVHDNLVVMAATNLETGKCIHVFDKNNGKLLLSTLNSGRGPKELLYTLDCNFNRNDGVMTFYDALISKKLWFNVDSLFYGGLSAVKEEPYIYPQWNRHIVDLSDGVLYIGSESYLYRDTSSVNRMEYCARNGDVLSVWNEFPEIDDDRKRFIMYYQDHVTLSPDETRMAIATSLGGILEIFSLDDGIIENTATKYFIEPDFDVKENGGYSFNENTVESFNDLTSTEDKIYAVFGGRILLKENFAKPVEDRDLVNTSIAVFDWKGSPEKIIHTDYRIEKICLDEEENMLYAVVNDIEGNAWIGRISI